MRVCRAHVCMRACVRQRERENECVSDSLLPLDSLNFARKFITIWNIMYDLFSFLVLGTEHRAFGLLGKCSLMEPKPQLCSAFLHIVFPNFSIHPNYNIRHNGTGHCVYFVPYFICNH